MERKPYVIGIGELKMDEIYKKNGYSLEFIRRDGGGTTWNVLCNLGAKGIDTLAVGVCGKDEAGDVCVNSLKQFNVNVKNIIRSGSKTQRVFITIPSGDLEDNTISSKIVSPITGEKEVIEHGRWHQKIIFDLDVTGIIIIENLKEETLTLAKELKKTNECKIVLDIGHRGYIRNFDDDTLVEKLKSIDVIQMNQVVTEYILTKLGRTREELFEQLGLESLILTKGSKGVNFLWKNQGVIQSKTFTIDKPAKIIDSCGAGDAFLSVFIKHFFEELRTGKELDREFFEMVFKEGTTLTREVVSYIGARGHLCSVHS